MIVPSIAELSVRGSHAVIELTDEQAASLNAEFHRLTEEWIADTSLMSDLADICQHPAYQRIIGMGSKAVPLILRELARKPYHWFGALNAVTGVDPAPSGCNFAEARTAWINWGRNQGIIE